MDEIPFSTQKAAHGHKSPCNLFCSTLEVSRECMVFIRETAEGLEKLEYMFRSMVQ